jgi:predicted HD phosphohydrolase
MTSSMADGALYTSQVGDALAYAAAVHAGQTRKGKPEPYLSHLLQVAAIVIRYGGTEDQIIAGLLHDAPEDHGGEERLADIQARYGVEVARIVLACSDSLTEDPDVKAPWRDRKADHLRHYQHELDPAVALVASADKIANLNDLVHDMRQNPGDPAETLDRFRGKAVGTRAYYASMMALLAPHLPVPAASQFAGLVTDLGAEPIPNGQDPVDVFLQRTVSLAPDDEESPS